MGNHEVLVRRFASANLRAEVIGRDRPVTSKATSGQGARDVFQLTILGKGREEYFRIWPGADTNRVEAEGLDPALRQLVLLVHEPSRTFLERVPKFRVQLDRTRVRVVGEDRTTFWIERRTESNKRHFLCGRDERQLFICQLPRAVTTVRDAHAALRAPEVVRARATVLRQGEWFFLPASPSELAALEAALRANRTFVQARVPIGAGGNPHVADERVAVPVVQTDGVVRTGFVLVRGRVRHVDHDTVRLPEWCKVVRNTEPVARDGVARMDGVRWVD